MPEIKGLKRRQRIGRSRRALVPRLDLQFFDLVLKRQLSSLEGGYLEFVGRGMGLGLVDLAFYVAMLSLQFLKMGSESHDFFSCSVSSSGRHMDVRRRTWHVTAA
jgi:hypothetical protein